MRNFIPAMFLSGLLLTPCYASGEYKRRTVAEVLENMHRKKGVILAEKTYFGQVTEAYSYQPTKKVSGWGGEGIVNAGPLLSYSNVRRFPIYATKVRDETGDTIFTESYNSAAGAPNTGRYYDIAAVYDAKYNPGDTVFFSLDKYGHFIVDEDWLKDGVSRERDALTRTDKSCPEPQVRDW